MNLLKFKLNFVKTFERNNVLETKRVINELIDIDAIKVYHTSTHIFTIDDLRDYETNIRCASKEANIHIKHYRPKKVSDHLYFHIDTKDKTILFFMFLSKIKKKGSRCKKYYICETDIFECEMTYLDAELFLPYTF